MEDDFFFTELIGLIYHFDIFDLSFKNIQADDQSADDFFHTVFIGAVPAERPFFSSGSHQDMYFLTFQRILSPLFQPVPVEDFINPQF